MLEWKKSDNLDMILDQLYEYDMVLLARFEKDIVEYLDIKDLLSEYVLVYKNDAFELWDVNVRKQYLSSKEQDFLKYLTETKDTGCYLTDFLLLVHYREDAITEKKIKKWFLDKI